MIARRVFFSFEYDHDVGRARVVRNSWVAGGKEAAGFVDAPALEALKALGEATIKESIDEQLPRKSVTAVLVGEHTCASRCVAYEVEQGEIHRNELLGIDISKIRDFAGETSERCGELPDGYPFYLWNKGDGHDLGSWIEAAGIAAGK